MDQVPSLDNTFGALFIGVVLGGVLYGVSCAQVFYYFQHYSKKDGLWIKATVIVSLICDTVHQALISHTVYTYLVTYYFQPQKLGVLVWSPVIAILFSAIVALLVQIFYVVRIWKFSKGNVIITAPLSIFIVGQFVSSVVWVAKGINMTMLVELLELQPISIIMDVTAVSADVLITVVFCALLRRARTNLQRSNRMISFLITFSVQTGMVTSVCAVVALIFVSVSPDTLVYGCFYFLLGRLYCNSLLATLNVRDAVRERGHASLGISLHPVDQSNPSSMANRREIDIKAEISRAGTHGYVAEVKSHDRNDSSPFVSTVSHIDSSQVV